MAHIDFRQNGCLGFVIEFSGEEAEALRKLIASLPVPPPSSVIELPGEPHPPEPMPEPSENGHEAE